ncbi:MAG TPA: hypothetical protein VMV20_05245 [Chitinophagaceae bacterium]|nr:hypothetical protein [Chitinophagaceae bacterium]
MAQSPFKKKVSWWKAIGVAGLVAGSLDGVAAVVMYYAYTGHLDFNSTFQYISSGVFGTAAFSGGFPLALLGVGFHFLIAFLFTIFYFLVYPRIRLQRIKPFISAIGYGLFIWLVMNLVVLPLSREPRGSFHLEQAIIAALILMALVGMPVSWLASRYYSRNGAVNRSAGPTLS